ncbi:MFS transporter [Roseomonas aerophila]|uniref:MFS transporter n=1 Tax=Teichococcus aerophilus TaxID=1224513 RepID=A0ABR7RJF0_9PROT|nr:MFS transporter [Pseudoroseomonas aerophila]MBC9206543.1 MFS transporter [Pseudoroseomonas aerophila]
MTPPTPGAPPAGREDSGPATAGALLLLMSLTALGQMATNIVVPSLNTIAVEMGLGAGSAGVIMSAVLAGLAFGQLVVGPVSDRVGRRPVLLAGLVLYVLASLAATFATHGAMLLVARLMQGLGASAGLALPRAIARDRYVGDHFLRAMSLLTLAMAVMPGLAPIMGGAIAGSSSWRAALAVSVAAGLAALVATLWALPETHRNRTGGGVAAVLGGYRTVLGNRPFLLYTLIPGAAFGGAYVEVAGAQALFGGLFGWSPVQLSLATACYPMGFLVGGLLAPRLGMGFHRRIQAGIALMLLGAVLFLGLTTSGLLTAFGAIGCVVLSQVGVGFMGPPAIGLALLSVKGAAGTASAVMGAIHMVIGAGGAAMVGAIAMPVAWSMPLIMLGFAMVAVLCQLLAGRPPDAPGGE